MKTRTLALVWACQIIAAVILGQTLFFKFSGAPESIYIFTTLGVEPWGRYASGVAELVAVFLLLIPRTAIYGALLGMGVMAGAIFSHLGPLGIEVANDGGTLFILALITFAASTTVAWFRRGSLPVVGKFLAPIRN